MVAKKDEQGRGQPLVGAAVPFRERLFWIALPDKSEQVKRNVALQSEGEWLI